MRGPWARAVCFLCGSLASHAAYLCHGTLRTLSPWPQVVPLSRTHLLLPERYPRFTLARQAAGSVVVGLEALRQLVPEVG